VRAGGPPPERRKGPTAATQGPLENTGNVSNDGRENSLFATAVKPIRELDRRFAADLAYLFHAAGPEETAWAVLRAAERVGFRAMLEEEISRQIWARHPGRRPTLAVFVSDRGER